MCSDRNLESHFIFSPWYVIIPLSALRQCHWLRNFGAAGSVWRKIISILLCIVPKLLGMCIWGSCKHSSKSFSRYFSNFKEKCFSFSLRNLSTQMWRGSPCTLQYSSVPSSIQRLLRSQVHINWAWHHVWKKTELPSLQWHFQAFSPGLRVLLAAREWIHAENAVL